MIVVGDIHGDIALVDAVLALKQETVFVGDFFDSFRYGRAQQIVAATKALESGATIILGNHEWSYINPEKFMCSGFDRNFWVQIQPLCQRLLQAAVPYVWNEEHKMLITHAGLTNTIFQRRISEVSEIPDALLEWYRDKSPNSPYFVVGRSRGGLAPEGGPIWCDWQKDFEPIEGVKQIFGHSASPNPPQWLSETTEKGLRRIHDSWNIDCLQRHNTVLNFNTSSGECTPLELGLPDD